MSSDSIIVNFNILKQDRILLIYCKLNQIFDKAEFEGIINKTQTHKMADLKKSC